MDFTVNERGLKLISTAIRHKARLCRSCDEFAFSAVQYRKARLEHRCVLPRVNCDVIEP